MGLARVLPAVDVRTDQLLTPTGDPRVFTTPVAFEHIPGADPQVPEFSIEVFHNMTRLRQTKTGQNPCIGDYVVEESGGLGTGFDTVRLISFTPKASSKLRANYRPA